MLDEVKLIYFYQLGAEGFGSGDIIEHPDYADTIIKATKNSYGDPRFRLQNITPKLMSGVMLNYLVQKCSI
jgi:hypothetical protein